MNNDHGVAVLLYRGESAYIAKRLKPGLFKDGWEFPGGSVDPGEDHFMAVVRETMEETGLKVDPARFEYLGFDQESESKNQNGEGFTLHCFAVELREDECPVNTEPHKRSDWELVHRDDILTRNVLPGCKNNIFAVRFFQADSIRVSEAVPSIP